MESIFRNLDLSLNLFLKVQYETILEEIKANRSQGQVIRRLFKEGYTMTQAEELYLTISKNQQDAVALAHKLTQYIDEQQKLKKQEEQQEDHQSLLEQKRKWAKEYEPPYRRQPHEDYEKTRKTEEFLHTVSHNGIHSAAHLLLKLIFPH